MEGSAANAKSVPCKAYLGTGQDGEFVTHIMVIASGDVVSIGVCTFKRDDLLLAMGVTQADIDRLESK